MFAFRGGPAALLLSEKVGKTKGQDAHESKDVHVR